MRGKNRVTIGFIAMMAVTGIVNVSCGFASDFGEVAATERIGHGDRSISRSRPKQVIVRSRPVWSIELEQGIDVFFESERSLSGSGR